MSMIRLAGKCQRHPACCSSGLKGLCQGRPFWNVLSSKKAVPFPQGLISTFSVLSVDRFYFFEFFFFVVFVVVFISNQPLEFQSMQWFILSSLVHFIFLICDNSLNKPRPRCFYYCLVTYSKKIRICSIVC